MREARELESGLVPISLSMADDLVQSHDGPAYAIDMLQLDESMVKFRYSYPDHAQFLQLYCFSGMSITECGGFAVVPSNCRTLLAVFTRLDESRFDE